MVRIVNSVLRRVMARLLRNDVTADLDQLAPHGQMAAADDVDIWVNARGKKIGSKRSRTKRLERRRQRDIREVQHAMKSTNRTARF